MGLFDKAKKLVAGNKDKVKDGIDKVAGVADDRTSNKHTGKIDDAAEKAKDAIDKLDGN